MPARDLLFAPGGPVLTARGRRWLEAVGARPMSLYEVAEVKPGEGLRLQDTLRPSQPAVWVRERSASRNLDRWGQIGARLALQEGDWVFTGALYPLARADARDCREEILDELGGEPGESAFARDLVSNTVATRWLRGLVAVGPLPEFVDASTGEPLMLVTEHYRVRDWATLEEVLAQRADVEGSRENGWVRFAEAGGDVRRSRAALNVREPDGLEVFCRTLTLADEARAWLDELVGEGVEHRTREVVDPRSAKAREGAPARTREQLPPELEAQLLHRFLRQHYETWTEEPIPALGGRTPRESLQTPEGRRAVVDLLKQFEQQETRRTRVPGGKPFDFGFLWERLGLTREE